MNQTTATPKAVQSVFNPITGLFHTVRDTPVAVLASIAGDRATKTAPMSHAERWGANRAQNGTSAMPAHADSLTARQRRRMGHKNNRALLAQAGGAL